MEKHLLFICSGNIDRSPAAEALFKNHPIYHAKSAGVGPLTENPVTKEMIDWAELIFCMEHEHKQHLIDHYPAVDINKIIVLNIPNTYTRNDFELKDLLKFKLKEWLENKELAS